MTRDARGSAASRRFLWNRSARAPGLRLPAVPATLRTALRPYLVLRPVGRLARALIARWRDAGICSPISIGHAPAGRLFKRCAGRRLALDRRGLASRRDGGLHASDLRLGPADA